MSGFTYLITGANRGIGKGLLEALVLRPNTTIIAGVRDIASTTAIFATIPLGPNSQIIPIKIDSTSDSDPTTAVQELETKHHITHLDVLISNAGLLESETIAPLLSSTNAAIRRHLETNALGLLTLLRAFFPLLSNSPNPKFFANTSVLGSIAAQGENPVPLGVYGVSKAAANYIVRKISFEVPELVAGGYSMVEGLVVVGGVWRCAYG